MSKQKKNDCLVAKTYLITWGMPPKARDLS